MVARVPISPSSHNFAARLTMRRPHMGATLLSIVAAILLQLPDFADGRLRGAGGYAKPDYSYYHTCVRTQCRH